MMTVEEALMDAFTNDGTPRDKELVPVFVSEPDVIGKPGLTAHEDDLVG